MFLFRLGARRQIGWKLRKPRAVEKVCSVFGVHSAPHGDTLEDVACMLDVAEVQECVCRMVEKLIRKKVLDAFRLLGKLWVIAIDGTGTVNYGERHCPYCLTRTCKKTGKTVYYHNVLEAKLVTPNGFAFSIMTEFIENPHEHPTKQDCELKALYRLTKRLKKRFPKLPIVLSLDGLYACGPVFDLCRKHNWHYIAVMKDDDLPSVREEFKSLAQLAPEDRLSQRTSKGELWTTQAFTWVNDISYVDTAKREHAVSVIECVETSLARKKVNTAPAAQPSTTPGDEMNQAALGAAPVAPAEGATPSAPPQAAGTEPSCSTRSRPRRRRRRKQARQEKHIEKVISTNRHVWVTDFTVTREVVSELANYAGRCRWKVENEGFNVQKNGGFSLEHAYSNDPNSAKVYYLLLQMARTLGQLMEKGSLLRRFFPQGFGANKNLAFDLLEAWRNAPPGVPEVCTCLQSRFQIRFDTS